MTSTGSTGLARARALGSTGVFVFPVGLGAMPLSLAGRPAPAEARAVIRAFVEGGGNFIDTANVYCMDAGEVGHNERLIGDALREFDATAKVYVGTKGGLTKEGSGWDPDGRPRRLRTSCEQSLRALGTDSIFLYQLHAPDPAVPFEESIGELVRLRERGWIEHIGLSNVNAGQIRAATALAPIATVQNKLHPGRKRDLSASVVQLCGDLGIGFIPHSPVGGHRAQSRLGGMNELASMSRGLGITPQQLAIAWLLHKGPHIIPIPGASRIESVRSSLAAAEIELSQDILDGVDRLPDW